jgi:hypothetical protein
MAAPSSEMEVVSPAAPPPPESTRECQELPAWGLWIGITLGIAGSIGINIGQNLQFQGISELEAAGEPVERPCRSRTWVLGQAVFIVFAIINFGCFALAPASVLTPLESIQFVTNIFYHKLVNQAEITREMYGGVALTCAGTSLIVVFGASGGSVCHSLQTLEGYWSEWLWLLWLIVSLGVAATSLLTNRALVRKFAASSSAGESSGESSGGGSGKSGGGGGSSGKSGGGSGSGSGSGSGGGSGGSGGGGGSGGSGGGGGNGGRGSGDGNSGRRSSGGSGGCRSSAGSVGSGGRRSSAGSVGSGGQRNSGVVNASRQLLIPFTFTLYSALFGGSLMIVHSKARAERIEPHHPWSLSPPVPSTAPHGHRLTRTDVPAPL